MTIISLVTKLSPSPCEFDWIIVPLLNHSPFCEQNLLYDNAQGGGGGLFVMIMFSDGSSFIYKINAFNFDQSKIFVV